MATGEATIPDEPLPDCIVPACCRESMTSATTVCRLHWDRYMRGRRNEPAYVGLVLEALAHIRGWERDEAETRTTDAFFALFDRIPRP